MKKSLNGFTFLIFVTLISLFSSCKKPPLIEEDIVPNSSDEPIFVEPSEEIIDGELFIDGVSQKEVITDFDIEGVQVIDDRLAFDDHDAMMNAIHRLSEYNTESVVAWSKKMGFTSLFTELTRIEERPVEEMQRELDKGDMLNEYFRITEQGELNLTKHTILLSRIFNTQGLIQVGAYVGIIAPGLTVWVDANNIEKLIKALKSHNIPDSDEEFIVVDKSAFDNSKSWFTTTSCPKYGTWIGPWELFVNINNNRRIEIKNSFHEFTTPSSPALPVGGFLFNRTYEYRIETVSKKSSWNKYKTDHYLSIDVKVRKEWANNIQPPGGMIRKTATEQDNDTKYGFIEVSLPSINNSLGLEQMVLRDILPGSSWLTGTAASHRGMGGRFGRLQCN